MRRTLIYGALAVAMLACRSSAPNQQTVPEPPKVRRDGPTSLLSADVHVSDEQLEQTLHQASAQDRLVRANLSAAEGQTLSVEVTDLVIRTADMLTREQLSEVWGRLEPTVFPAPLLAYRRARFDYEVGDLAGAQRWLKRVPEYSDLRSRADELALKIRNRIEVVPAVVAVILPLSGKYSGLGKEALAAIQLASKRFPEVKLQVLDTKGNEVKASAAVERAVFTHHAVAVLGPMGVHETRAAARRAARLGIPMAALSAPLPPVSGALPARGAGIFHLWSSPQWEAYEAARVAADLGYDKFAVLVPDDEQGRAQAKMFHRAASAFGADVVRSGSYAPIQADFESDIKAFLGLDPKSNRRLRRHLARYGQKKGWKTFSPDIDFEVLFIPDQHNRAVLVASFLPYLNVEVRARDIVDLDRLKRKHNGRMPLVVQLIGGSEWHHPGFLAGGPAVNGALLVDVFAGGGAQEYVYEASAVFARTFAAAAGRRPSAVAAQAFDAATLVFRTARAVPRNQARAHFVHRLATARLGQGVCGPARITPAGTLYRKAVVLRVESGQFVLHGY